MEAPGSALTPPRAPGSDGGVLRRLAIALLVAPGLLASCGRPPAVTPPVPPPPFEPVTRADWPEVVDDLDPSSLVDSFLRAAAYLDGLPAERPVDVGPVRVSAARLAASLRRLAVLVAEAPPGVDLGPRLAEEFQLLRSTGRDGRGEVLFTGYYEPVLPARRTPEGGFTHPLWALPRDLVTVDLADFGIESDPARLVGRVESGRLLPYPERDAIDHHGALDGRAAPIAFLADPVDAFLLHVQGSGTLELPDGSRTRVGYAGSNGRPYRSIGRLLIDEGRIPAEQMSMQAIRSWLAANPEELRRVLGSNPSYVFFRPLSAEDGPLGCFGVPLVAHRSVAVDRRLVPAPVPGWLRTRLPIPGGGAAPVRRFVVSLDTGGAIRGPGRVDVFFGSGDDAGELAGRTAHLGELYLLLPR